MKFGLFCLMTQRDSSHTIARLYDENTTLVQLAEQIGFDIAWLAEHHFSNYSMCPSPHVMAGYLAARTQRIKLGAAILVLPLYQPVRMLEEIGMVDILSGGRTVIGIGAGYQDFEFKRFGVRLEDNWAMTHEMLDLIELAYTKASFKYEGRHYKLPEMPIAVQPLQKPMPPVYVAGNEPAMLQRLARNGYISFHTVGYNATDALLKVRSHVESNFRAAGVPANKLNFAYQRYIYVSDDRKDVLEAAERVLYTSRVAAALRGKYEKLQGTFIEAEPFPGELSLEQIAKNVYFGDPDTIAEKMAAEIKVLKPQHISCFMQFGGMEGKRSLKSMERFGAEVLPRLRKALPDLDRIGETA
jgi:alkanesulfonate monooxygenase SsuD/methylene tetrahydromethanopterin reductase-like flavin-dependent oxidoreductase (luciferase family)